MKQMLNAIRWFVALHTGELLFWTEVVLKLMDIADCLSAML